MEGPGFDFMSSSTANLPLAQSYLKKAGFGGGKYAGRALLTVAANNSPGKEVAETFQNQLEKVGVKLNLKEIPVATGLSKYCEVPKAAVAICPSLGWGADFFAAQSFIDPLFNGQNIVPSGNVNTAQVDDTQLNAKIVKAKEIIGPAASANAWAELDKTITGQAYFITWLWDNNIALESTNLKGVTSRFNSGSWDLAFSSLK